MLKHLYNLQCHKTDIDCHRNLFLKHFKSNTCTVQTCSILRSNRFLYVGGENVNFLAFRLLIYWVPVCGFISVFKIFQLVDVELSVFLSRSAHLSLRGLIWYCVFFTREV